jgi:hypothetical protein
MARARLGDARAWTFRPVWNDTLLRQESSGGAAVTDASNPRQAIDRLLDRLDDAGRALAALEPAVRAGEPWPLSTSIGVEPEAHWGPPEVLAHVAEMLPFWLGEIERILAGSPEPVPFGRIATDEIRLAVIERDRTVPSRELFDRTASDIARYRRRLSQLGVVESSRRGLHPTRGELPIPAILERFVTGHLEDHVEQLQGSLRTA